MEVRSIYKYARISPFKVREVTREIQGLPVSAALDLLAFTPKKAAFLINKTLKSAIANAENNANLSARQWQPHFKAHESYSHRVKRRDSNRNTANEEKETRTGKESLQEAGSRRGTS